MNRRVTVMGLGRFGGGVGVTRWLVERQSCTVLLTDLAGADDLRESLDSIRDLIDSGAVKLRLGEHRLEDFASADLVVVNPAVPHPWDNEFLVAAELACVPITTEIRLLVESLPNRMKTIGITGTAGKSTTAAMIHHILNACGQRAKLGGNIGGSLLGAEIANDEWVVLELSSAMLYWLNAKAGYSEAEGWSPHIGVLTNIAPNHLDWHKTIEDYEECKSNIVCFQDVEDIMIAGSKRAKAILGKPPTLVSIANDSAPIHLVIPGAHNVMNARMAIEAAFHAAGIDRKDASESLRTFAGLPHRLQLVHETTDGRRFFNDSKSTTPEATRLAIEAFGEDARGHIHLIAGGYDKEIDLTAISNAAKELAGLYTIGTTGQSLAANAASPNAEYVETLDAAVERAMKKMTPGDLLLLSPGCASWDQFTNFEERGERFARLVQTGK